jgi:hypothetical protein
MAQKQKKKTKKKRKSSQQRFIAERVRALAVVYLTRRDDLIVTEEPGDVGIDLSVTLNVETKGRHRKFGVELRGDWAAVTADHANQVLRPAMHEMRRYGPFAFPVVLFFFTMENNEGWYTWAAEPVVSSTGEFEIVQRGEASCRPLNSGAIDEIVDAVDRWYDAFFSRATRETPDEHRKKSSANKERYREAPIRFQDDLRRAGHRIHGSTYPHGGGQPLADYLSGLWSLGRTDDFLLSLYGHVAYHQAEGHLTAYEQISFPPGQKIADYCLPCQLVAARAARRLQP